MPQLAALVLLLAGPALAQEAPADPVAAGSEVYSARCATCHGPEGKGDGPAASALPRKPKDMTTAEFWAENSLASIRTSILKGRPGTAMRAYPMDDARLDALVAYLQTFAPKG